MRIDCPKLLILMEHPVPLNSAFLGQEKESISSVRLSQWGWRLLCHLCAAFHGLTPRSLARSSRVRRFLPSLLLTTFRLSGRRGGGEEGDTCAALQLIASTASAFSLFRWHFSAKPTINMRASGTNTWPPPPPIRPSSAAVSLSLKMNY